MMCPIVMRDFISSLVEIVYSLDGDSQLVGSVFNSVSSHSVGAHQEADDGSILSDDIFHRVVSIVSLVFSSCSVFLLCSIGVIFSFLPLSFLTLVIVHSGSYSHLDLTLLMRSSYPIRIILSTL